MDASRLTLALAVLIAAYGLGRLVLGSASRAGDGMAALFVPPDRSLGWPRGVQEGDEPWGWRAAPAPDSSVPDADHPAAAPGIEAALAAGAPRSGRYVAAPRKVAPIHVRTRPQRDA